MLCDTLSLLEKESGDSEANKSYLEARRVGGKKGGGKAGGTAVLSFLKRYDKVVVPLVKSCSK
jgi:hypothetical protein